MKQIQTLAAELEGFKNAAKLIIDMVDPVEGEAVEQKSLLQHLWEVPQKFTIYVSETTKSYVATTLGILMSWYSTIDLQPLTGGLPANYSDKKFAEYTEEVRSVANKIVDDIE